MNGVNRIGKFELRLRPLPLASARRLQGGSFAAHAVARLGRPRIGSITPPAVDIAKKHLSGALGRPGFR